MKLLKYSALIFLLFSGYTSLSAQEEQQTQSIDDGTIGDQFEFVIKKSSNWNDNNGQPYEVIRRNMIQTLKAHAVDSLNAIQSKLDKANNAVNTQQKEIDALKNELTTTQATLDSTNEEKDSMSFFGAQMSKSGYNTLMWTIIIGLLVFLLFFIYQFKNGNLVTKEAKSKLAEIEDEFAEHRRVALEREQKVKRELQDVLNKYKGV